MKEVEERVRAEYEEKITQYENQITELKLKLSSLEN